MNNKEAILLATLELASQNGLGNISLSQIAKRVGIQKPGLYNHFSSKEDLIQKMYEYVRMKAREKAGVSVVDYEKLVADKTAEEILTIVINNYSNMKKEYSTINFCPYQYASFSIVQSFNTSHIFFAISFAPIKSCSK